MNGAAALSADMTRQLLVPQIHRMPWCLPTVFCNSWAGAWNQIVHLSSSLEGKKKKEIGVKLERSHDSCCRHDDGVEMWGLFRRRYERFCASVLCVKQKKRGCEPASNREQSHKHERGTMKPRGIIFRPCNNCVFVFKWGELARTSILVPSSVGWNKNLNNWQILKKKKKRRSTLAAALQLKSSTIPSKTSRNSSPPLNTVHWQSPVGNIDVYVCVCGWMPAWNCGSHVKQIAEITPIPLLGNPPISCHWFVDLLARFPFPFLSFLPRPSCHPSPLQTCHLERQMPSPNCWPAPTATGATSAWHHWRSTSSTAMRRTRRTSPAPCATTRLRTALSSSGIWPHTSLRGIRLDAFFFFLIPLSDS